MRFLFLALMLTACDPTLKKGYWNPIQPPPGAAPGTMCWQYGGGYASTSWGGAWCQPPSHTSPIDVQRMQS